MRKISLKQEDHMNEIIDDFIELMEPKYVKGAIEHNSNIWEYPTDKLLDMAIEEAIDQVVYLLTLKQQINKRK